MRVVAQAEGGPGEEIDGEIDRVRLAEAGQTIRDQVLSVPAIVGANSKADVVVEVSIENGAEPPLAIQSVKLEMRERKLCFDVPGGPLRLFYGDDKLPPPAYDYTRSFHPDEVALRARLDIEHRNPAFVGEGGASAFSRAASGVALVTAAVAGVDGGGDGVPLAAGWVSVPWVLRVLCWREEGDFVEFRVISFEF